MAGAGTEVGRIHIKVTPDTDGFRAALVREVKAAAAGVTAGVKAELTDAAQVSAELNAVARDRKAKIQVETSFAGRALAQLREIQDRLRESGKEIGLFQSAAAGLERKIRTIPTRPELIAGWEDDIRMELARAQSLAVDINPRMGGGAKLQRELAGEMSRLKWLAGIQKITIEAEVKVDRRNLSKALSGIATTAKSAAGASVDALKAIGSAVANAGNSALDSIGGFRAFGVGLGTMLAAAVLVPPALALLTGSLLTLPGLFAGLTVPMAAVALGLDGIKKAAENSGLFDPTGGKFGDGGMGKALDEIREKVSETFEQGLTPAFQKFVGFMPNLTTGFQSVASGLSDMANSTVNAFVNKLPQIQSTISNIGQGLANAAPGVGQFTEAIIQLAEGVAQKFPGLGTAFTNMMTDFNAWVDKFTMKDPLTGVSQLDTALKSLGDAARAAWGFLGQIAGVSLENLNRPGFGESVKDFFKACGDFVTNTLPGLQKGFEAIAGLADALSPVLRVIGLISNGAEMTKDLITAASKPGGLAENAKNMESMQAAMARMQQSAQNGGSFLDQWVEGSSGYGHPKILEQIPQQAAQAGQQAAAQFTQNFNQQLPVGTPISGAEQMLQPVVDQAKTAGQQTAAASTQMTQQVAGDTNSAMAMIQSLGNTATAVETQFGSIVQVFAVGSQQAVIAMSSQFAQIPYMVSTAFTGITSLVSGAMGGLVQSVGTGAAQMSTAMSSNMAQIPTHVNLAFAPLPGIVEGMMQLVVSTVLTKAGECVTTIAPLPGQMAAVIASGQGALIGPGQALMAGLKSGIVAGMADVLAYVQTIAGQIAANKGPLPKDKKELIPAGLALMDGLNKGLSDGFDGTLQNVKGMATAILEAIKEVFGSAEGLNLNFNFGGGGGGFGGGPFGAMSTSMKGLATDTKQFQTNMAGAALPAGMLAKDAKAQSDELSRQLNLLEQQRKYLELSKNGVAKGSPQMDNIKAELEQIRQQKLALGLQKDQLTYAMKYGGVVEDTNLKFDEQLKTLTNMPVDFAKTTATGAMQDFGISGNGALGALIDYGLEAGSKYIFNVSNSDEAIAISQNQQWKEASGMVGR